MTDERAQSRAFREVTSELVANGLGFRFQARGRSMLPSIQDGDLLHVRPVDWKSLKVADIVLFRDGAEFKAHRVIRKKGDIFVTRGDSSLQPDVAIRGGQIVGKIIAKECADAGRIVPLEGRTARLRFVLSEARRRVSRTARALGPMRTHGTLLAFVLMSLSLSLRAQVTVDNSASTSVLDNTAGSSTITLPLTVTAGGTNRLLVVGVSINTAGNAGSSVTGITYNGVAFTAAPFTAEANSFRVEMWYLINPATGSNNVVVTVNKNGGGGQKMGVVVGAIDFTGADQVSPISAFVSNSATAMDTVQINVPSASNEMVMDTVTMSASITPTATAPQVQRWNLASTGTPTGQNAEGFGSTHPLPGAPIVPMSEKLSTNGSWTVGAISIRPPQADVGVTLTGSTSLFP